MANQDRLNRLIKYADGLKQRLNSPIPPKHNASDASRAAFKQMLEFDLKKTEMDIAKLKG